MIKILEFIALLIFLFSLGGMFVIFVKKTPLLASLPKTTPVFEKKKGRLFGLFGLWQKAKEKIGSLPVLKNFSPEAFLQRFLQKTLSRFRVLVLKIENKTGSWLESLRKRAQENNDIQKKNDDYWKNLQPRSNSDNKQRKRSG